TDLEQGEHYQIRLRPGFQNSSYVEFWRVWIDFNQNGEFENNEKVYQGRGRNEKVGNIQIPFWARTGDTRMRVSMRYGGYPQPCSDGFEGEVEDYTVHIDGFNPGDLDWRPDGTTDLPIVENIQVEDDTAPIISDRSDAQSIHDETAELRTNLTIEPQLQVFPNPAMGPVRIDVSGFELGEAYELIIVNAFGQRVYQQSFTEGGPANLTIDPAALNMLSGNYAVRAVNADKAVSGQLIIQR
ncbi:MAG: GEVED domain-containing protein, partial [Bacteroidota bacterium]